MTSRAYAIRLRQAAAVAAALAVAACHRTTPKTTDTRPMPGDTVQVGYGSQARRDVTGSVTSISGDVVRQSTVTSMADFLEGRVPGLEVRRLSGGNISVRIRGDRSLLRDGEPLYVVDGIPMQGGTGFLADLDPRDIRSVEVLKDAGSLAAYGSRGANGVILISMKRPPQPER